LLADEPTGNLDLMNKFDVVELLKKINGFGTTVVLATHDDKSVNLISRRVVALDRGKVVSDQENAKYPIL